MYTHTHIHTYIHVPVGSREYLLIACRYYNEIDIAIGETVTKLRYILTYVLVKKVVNLDLLVHRLVTVMDKLSVRNLKSACYILTDLLSIGIQIIVHCICRQLPCESLPKILGSIYIYILESSLDSIEPILFKTDHSANLKYI